MKAWMLSIARRAWPQLASKQEVARRPRSRRNRVGFEGLERREVLSGVIPFGTFTGSVTTAGQPTAIAITFAANQVTTTGAKPVLIGFYAETAAGSAIEPAITEVDGPTGQLAPLALPNHTKAPLPKTVFLTEYTPVAGEAQTITVDVSGLDATTGNVVLQAFLPGDVNGDRTVDATDLAQVKASYGSALGQANYNGQADFNGDGHVGCIDRRLTEMNQGASIGAFPITTSAAVPVAATAVTITSTPVVTTSVPVSTTSVQTIPIATTQATTVTIPTAQSGTLVPTTTSGTTYVIGQPVVQGSTTTTAATSTTPGTYYVLGQAGAQGATTSTGQATTTTSGTTYVIGQPVVQGSTTTAATSTTPGTYYVLGQAGAQGSTTSTGQATTSAPVYVLYPATTQAPTTVTSSTLIPTTTSTVSTVPTTVPTTVTIPTATSTTATIPASNSYQPGESGPVYYYGQAVVQAPTSSQSSLA